MAMLHDPRSKRRFHITFYAGYRRVIATTTVVAGVYTIHEILVEMALKNLPKHIAKIYNRTAVMQGEFVEEEFAS